MKFLLVLMCCLSLQTVRAGVLPVVIVETNKGSFEVELDSDHAPVTAQNFLKYVDSGFYAETIFHRIVPNFVIQGGGLDKDLIEKPTLDPIVNEAGNGLSNLKGTVAMARTEVVDSATAQFYVNTKDNLFLDHKDNTPAHFGYAVFGKVTKGYDVIEAIEKVPTQTVGEYEGVPVEPVIILTMKRK